MKLHLIERKTEAPNIESFFFKPSELISWKAGQFLHYVLHHEPTDNRGSDRWFTVASAPFENKIMITTRFAEDKGSSFKETLKGLKIGDVIEVSDIDGEFVIDDLNAEYVFIAGGIGITPFRAILKELDHNNQSTNITLLYANRDEHIMFKSEIEDMAERNPNLKIHYILLPEMIDEKRIREWVVDITKPIFYISGPEPMVEGLGKTLKNMGVSDDHLKQDWFPGYDIV